MTGAYQIRRATVDDVAVIAHQRGAMLRDAGMADEATAEVLRVSSIAPLTAMLSREEYLGWLVEFGEQIVSGGGIILRRLLPRPGSLQMSYEAYILNVYTEPAHRRCGVARMLTTAMIDWCREQGIRRVVLHASNEGEPLYQSLGFERTTEMLLTL